MKKDGAVIPTNTLFLTFNTAEQPKLIRVGCLQVKANLFVPNPLWCFGCNMFGHKSVYVDNKMNTKDSVLDHRCAPTARVLTHLPLKIAQCGRRRKKFNVYALRNASLFRQPDGW